MAILYGATSKLLILEWKRASQKYPVLCFQVIPGLPMPLPYPLQQAWLHMCTWRFATGRGQCVSRNSVCIEVFKQTLSVLALEFMKDSGVGDGPCYYMCNEDTVLT